MELLQNFLMRLQDEDDRNGLANYIQEIEEHRNKTDCLMCLQDALRYLAEPLLDIPLESPLREQGRYVIWSEVVKWAYQQSSLLSIKKKMLRFCSDLGITEQGQQLSAPMTGRELLESIQFILAPILETFALPIEEIDLSGLSDEALRDKVDSNLNRVYSYMDELDKEPAKPKVSREMQELMKLFEGIYLRVVNRPADLRLGWSEHELLEEMDARLQGERFVKGLQGKGEEILEELDCVRHIMNCMRDEIASRSFIQASYEGYKSVLQRRKSETSQKSAIASRSFIQASYEGYKSVLQRRRSETSRENTVVSSESFIQASYEGYMLVLQRRRSKTSQESVEKGDENTLALKPGGK